MSQDMLVLVQIVAWMGVAILLVVTILMVRANLVKKTRAKPLLVQVKPAAGKGYQELCEYSKGVVTIPEKKKKGVVVRVRQEGIVAKSACWTIDYPQNMPSFIQVQVDTVVLREGDLIPLTEDSERPIISATRVANLLSEKDTSETIRRSGQISDPNMGKTGGYGLLWVYILLGVIVLAVGGLVYVVASGKAEWIQELMKNLEVIKIGLGVN